MAKSKIHETIVYPESRRMDSEDQGHKSVIYESTILPDDSTMYRITLGKAHLEFSHLGVTYYPIYLMTEANKIRGKIGVFEIPSTKAPSILDEDDDIRIDLMGLPVLFSHVTQDFLLQNGFRVQSTVTPEIEVQVSKTPHTKSKSKSDSDSDSSISKVEHPIQDPQPDEEEIDESERAIFDLPVGTAPAAVAVASASNSSKTTPDSIFTVDKSVIPSILPDGVKYKEETEAIAKSITEAYQPKSNDSWLVQKMRNAHYHIKAIPGDGDCFFTTIQKAFESIGEKTTVQQLRDLLANEVTVAQVETYRDLYNMSMSEYHDLQRKVKQNAIDYKELNHSRKTPALSQSQAKIILEKTKSNLAEKEIIQTELEVNKETLEEFGFMKAILYNTMDEPTEFSTAVEKFKMYVQSKDFWADAWAVSTMERLLNIKTIIVQNPQEDESEMMRCTNMVDDIEKYKNYNPKYYVMCHYLPGLHYELVTYNHKAIFTFEEIPYDMKKMVVKVCLEKNAGPLALIPAFRQFRHDIGLLSEGEGDDYDDSASSERSEEAKRLYDELPMLQIHVRAADALPGKKNTDKMVASNNSYFADLITFLQGKQVGAKEKEQRKQWRKMLDDSWTKCKFEVDNKDWASVKHYLMAVPFKEKYPNIYNQFSLSDRTSDIAQDLEKAKASLKPKGIHGVAFKAVGGELKDEMETFHRLEALRAKFQQNADLTTILVKTRMAKIQKYIPSKAPYVDMELMQIRREILDKLE